MVSVMVGWIRNWNRKTVSARTVPRGFPDAMRLEISLRKLALEGRLRNWKTISVRTVPRGFTDAVRLEISLRKSVLEGRLRNWKIVSIRTLHKTIF